MTGEKALADGCGKTGRPYKYRGESHVQALRQVLKDVREELWLVGFTPSLPEYSIIRIPGNNVFLCALECHNSRFVMLQGNSCGCAKSPPDLLPTSGQLPTFSTNSRLRCPGTYDQICGTVSTYSVYRSMLPESVRWAKLVERPRYGGRKAFLYKPRPISMDGSLLLMAEANWTSKMGYICNGTSRPVPGPTHNRHIWAHHSPAARETWRNACNMCVRNGSQLLMLSRDDDDCIQEIQEQMEEGQGYWVALSRQNVSLWLDGTPMREPAIYHDHGQAGCLVMSLKQGDPTFTFESCTGIQLQVLCEKDSRIHLETFTHDDIGNHVTAARRTSGVDNTYSTTVSALIAVLVLLSFLSVVLVVCLCNRDRFLPRRKVKRRPANDSTNGEREPVASPPDETPPGHVLTEGESDAPENNRSERESLQTHPKTPGNSYCPRDSLGYTVVTKGRQIRPPTTTAGCGGDNASRSSQTSRSSPTSRSVEYTEVCVSDVNHDSPDQEEEEQKYQDDLNKSRSRAAALRAESKDTVAGSEDTTYSVLSYRRAIQRAWVGLKRTAAYAHVIVRRPKKGDETDDTSHAASGGDVGVYDVTQPVAPRVPCIDNVYDHTEPQHKVRTPTARVTPRKMKRPSFESVV
nr:hypothetical protein BaRGS_009554 [Batillaria attramentaria]